MTNKMSFSTNSFIVLLMLFFTTLGNAQNVPTLVKDIIYGAAGSNPSNLTALAPNLFFFTSSTPNKTLYKSDGTEAGTQAINTQGFFSGNMAALNGKLYFTSSTISGANNGVYLLNSTDGTTTSVIDTLFLYQPTPTNSFVLEDLFVQNGVLQYKVRETGNLFGDRINFFSHNGARNGSTPIYTDGGESTVFYGQNSAFIVSRFLVTANNASGITLSINRKTGTPTTIKPFQYSWNTSNVAPNAALLVPIGVVAATDIFYATINDTLVKFNSNGVRTNIKTGVGNAYFGAAVSNATSTVFFANDRNELWKSDGTTAGTVKITTPLSVSEKVSKLVSLNGNIYMSTLNLSVVPSLFKVTGTNVTKIAAANEGSFSNFFAANNKLYWFYGDNTGTTYLYEEGTSLTTTKRFNLLTDGRPFISSPTSQGVVSSNNVFYYPMTANGIGGELWKLNLNPPTVPLPDFSIRISNLRVNTSQVGTPRDPYSTPTSLDYVITASNLDLTDTRPLNVRAYVSNDSIFSTDDAPLVFQSLSQRDLPFNLITNGFPVSLRTAGLKYIFLKVDSENGVVEANENNNVSNPLPVDVYAVSCASNGVSPYNEWVSNVKLNTINNTSEKTRYGNIFGFQVGYSNFLDVSTTLNKGQTYPLSITPSLGYPTYPTNLFTRVWIDYNQNGVFEDAEIVLAKNGNQVATQNITVPTTALTGTTVLRVSMKAGAYPTACEVFDKGEVEDYALTIQAGTPVGNACRNQDSLQLVSLYNATGGANWTIKWNLATPINTWNGVTLNANGCVSGLLVMGNNLTGTLPNLSLSALTFMNLSGNQLSSAIPNFTGLPLLEELVLYSNKLTGAIPNLNLPKLKFLIVYNNQLSGTVPNLNLPSLLQFDANTNKLSGTLPNFNLPQLTRLDFQGNVLTGSIPNFNLPNLQGLTLVDNQLTGAIPNFNLPKLTNLNLDKNQLSGTIPNLSLPSLTGLALSNNKFTGSIPLFTVPNIVAINLSNNLLSSCLPVYLQPLCGKSVDISGNPGLFNQNFATFCSNGIGSCEAPLPDFRMTNITQAQGSDLTTTTYPPVTGGFGFNYTVVNNGGAYVSPVTAVFYLSKDTILDSRDSLFTRLLAGATGTFLAGGPVPNLPDGDYYLIGKANGDNAIPETNANNNVFVLKTPKVKIRSKNVADLNVLLSTDRGFYQPFTTLTYLLVVENRGTTPFSNIKVEFKFPANTVSGGAAVPTVGTWQEWCAGGVQCYTWTIPAIAAGANAQLNVPLFILNTSAPIVATAKLLSSTPVDANVANNSATYTITKQPAPTTQGLVFQVPTQRVPVVIQRIAPNPTEGEVIVKLDSWKEQTVDFNFSDITGKTIHCEKRTLEKGVNRVAFDLYALPQGVYFIQTNVGKGTNVPTKFVKM